MPGTLLAPNAPLPPAAFAQPDPRQPRAQCVRWGLIVLVEPVTSRVARPLLADSAQRDRHQRQGHYVRRGIFVREEPVTSRVARPPPAAIAQRDHRQPRAYFVRWGIFAWAGPETSRTALPPSAAFVRRDHRLAMAKIVQTGITVKVASATSVSVGTVATRTPTATTSGVLTCPVVVRAGTATMASGAFNAGVLGRKNIVIIISLTHNTRSFVRSRMAQPVR